MDLRPVNQRHISALEKLTLSGLNPNECEECGIVQ